jgi:hypothetical protein
MNHVNHLLSNTHINDKLANQPYHIWHIWSVQFNVGTHFLEMSDISCKLIKISSTETKKFVFQPLYKVSLIKFLHS